MRYPQRITGSPIIIGIQMALPAANAKKVKVSACLLLVCSLAGGTRRSANVSDRRVADAGDIQIQAVRKSLQDGTELFHREQYPEASSVFQTAFRMWAPHTSSFAA